MELVIKDLNWKVCLILPGYHCVQSLFLPCTGSSEDDMYANQGGKSQVETD